jgi:hypothetical protein
MNPARVAGTATRPAPDLLRLADFKVQEIHIEVYWVRKPYRLVNMYQRHTTLIFTEQPTTTYQTTPCHNAEDHNTNVRSILPVDVRRKLVSRSLSGRDV